MKNVMRKEITFWGGQESNNSTEKQVVSFLSSFLTV